MRKTLFGLAVAGALALSASAQADMILNVTNGGTSGGYDCYNFYALNNGTNGTGTYLQGTKTTITTPGTTSATAIKINLRDLDYDELMDANLRGLAINPSTFTTTKVGTFLQQLNATAPTFVGVNGSLAGSKWMSNWEDIDPAFLSNNVHALRFEIATQSNATKDNLPLATSAVNGGLGYLFAHVVVPTGTGVTINAQLAGDGAGVPSYAVSWTNVPEPASMAMLALGGLLMFRRR